ncbi:MAG: PIG-L family deacetylase, partial [Planctomycetes bacterium]|nr:PIG-L family deacetylase [Planctomycetota bacterium]
GRAVAADPPFDATFRFLPLRDFRSVPDGRVVVLAPHPDDEVIGAGGAIALHAGRGDEVVVVHLTDGAGGDREARQGGAIARVRREEARAAGQVLGVSRTLGLDFPDGGLRPEGAFLAGLCALLETLRPRVLYVPSPFEHHPDHRAAYLLAAAALEHLAPAPAVFLYEVNEPQPAGFLLDVTPVLALKDQALCCFSSQRAYLDVAAKTLHANRARTVNVDLPEVEAAEAYLEIEPARMREWVGFAAAARAFREGAAPRAAPDAALDPARPRAPVSAVIATWNKRDDLRENLRALERQTIPPAEIIVVDNCSKDGTADMIREEFPEVRLLSSSSDQTGACETFNMGFKAATQPYVAIMDDDVVAPPAWLETLVRRMEQEPPSTAMISSKVVEPGMPDEFIRSERVNRERYMATFRGCGTLARSEVLRRAGYYDEVFFIYGNERDLAARVLGLGCRILQLPDAEIFHKTPFGMKAGRRSLYFHVRNFWLYAFKNCSWRQILAAAFALGLKGLGRRRGGHASDATGTIGLERSLKDTRGGLWIACRATFAALLLLPHCLRNRKVCRADDFEPPLA